MVQGFFFKLFGQDPSEPDTLKWVQFGKRMLAVLFFAVISAAVVFTYMAISQSRRILRNFIDDKGQSIARAIAQASFVPLVLEDKGALQRIFSAYREDLDLVYLKVLNFEGTVEFGISRPTVRVSPGKKIEIPVMPSHPEGAEEIIGTVQAGISYERIDKEIGAIARRNITGSAILAAFILTLGVILIRRMTVRMRNIVGEARLAEALRSSNQELEQFAYAASHDLQEPLRMVASYTQLLERRYKGRLDRDADDFIGFAVGGAARMQAMINDLLEYSRVGRQKRHFQRIDSELVVKDVLKNLSSSIEESGAEITYDPLPMVFADASQITRLFQNLIGNAIKYCKENTPPRVHISVSSRKKEWVFCVRDNGIGIDPLHHERIFVIFQRLYREQYPGTGIGLAICKKIVERHGGHIWVESQEGQGASFCFTLPFIEEKSNGSKA